MAMHGRYNLSDARANLAKTMDQVFDDHSPIIITRKSGKNVVLMSVEDFASWQETAYLLRTLPTLAVCSKVSSKLKKGWPPFGNCLTSSPCGLFTDIELEAWFKRDRKRTNAFANSLPSAILSTASVNQSH